MVMVLLFELWMEIVKLVCQEQIMKLYSDWRKTYKVEAIKTFQLEIQFEYSASSIKIAE